jgi:hypothetical protein
MSAKTFVNSLASLTVIPYSPSGNFFRDGNAVSGFRWVYARQ